MEPSELNNDWIDQIQLEPIPLEPVEQLAPYLSGIDLSATDQQLDQLATCWTAPEHGHWSSSCSDSLQAMSPNSLPSGGSSLSGSSPGSPLSRQQSLSSYSSSCWSSCWLPSSPSSTCSSAGRCARSQSSSSKTKSLGLRKSSSTKSAPTGRSQNATAAERYRLKLKRGQCNLMELVEIEEARNAELKRALETKLQLYREFVHLLANNLDLQDAELASLGRQSLQSILAESDHPSRDQVEVSSDEEGGCAGSERSFGSTHHESDANIKQIDHELKVHLNRFQQVADASYKLQVESSASELAFGSHFLHRQDAATIIYA